MQRFALIGLAIIAGVAQAISAFAAPIERDFSVPVRPVQNDPHTKGDESGGARGTNSGQPRKEINTLKELFAAIRHCYVPPSLDQARPGMRITVQFAYTRDGEIFGKPRILYESPDATPQQQSAYRAAVAAALARCTPLPFSRSLGNAVAGRVFAIQFVDERNLRGA